MAAANAQVGREQQQESPDSVARKYHFLVMAEKLLQTMRYATECNQGDVLLPHDSDIKSGCLEMEVF